MDKKPLSPFEQKKKLLEQHKSIQAKLAEFDTKRTAVVGNLARRYKLIDLADDILEQEFKALRDKYKLGDSAKMKPISEHKTKKK